MKKFLLLFLCAISLGCSILHAANDKFILILDAGHGGHDHGAIRGKYREKNINLGVTLELGRLIEANMKDVKVIYTRKTDVFIPLQGRADIANKAKANLFISIHTNSTAAKATAAVGTETFILGLAQTQANLEVAKRENAVILLEDDYSTKYEGFDPNLPESWIIFEFMTNKYMDQSLEAADYIQSCFKTVAKRKDRGVHQSNLLVLRQTSAPSILIELGFINHTGEGIFLNSNSGQKLLAKSIFEGFKKYKLNFDKMQGKKTVTNITAPSTQAKAPKALASKTIDQSNKKKETPSQTKANVAKAKAPEKTKDQTKTAPPVEQIPKDKPIATPIPAGQTEYRVQILTSPTKLPENSPRLKGVSPVDYYVDKGVYKYTHGSTTSIKTATNIQNKLRKKFKDCFVLIMKGTESKELTTTNSTTSSRPTQPKPEPKRTPETPKHTETTANIATTTSTIPAGQIEYRVQILTSPSRLSNNSPKLRGISPVSFYLDGRTYKYTYGSTTSLTQIQNIQKELRRKFKDCFIIKMKDGKRVK